MIIKMKGYSEKEKYYRIKMKNVAYTEHEYGREITEKELREKLILIKNTLNVAEDFVSGDETAHLQTGNIEDRVEIYKRVLSKIYIDVIFEEVSHEKVFDL